MPFLLVRIDPMLFLHARDRPHHSAPATGFQQQFADTPQPLGSLRSCPQQGVGDRGQSQAGVVIIDNALKSDSLIINMQMPQHILPIRRFDFPGIADVNNTAQS